MNRGRYLLFILSNTVLNSLRLKAVTTSCLSCGLTNCDTSMLLLIKVNPMAGSVTGADTTIHHYVFLKKILNLPSASKGSFPLIVWSHRELSFLLSAYVCVLYALFVLPKGSKRVVSSSLLETFTFFLQRSLYSMISSFNQNVNR